MWKVPVYVQTILAMVLGTIVGVYYGERAAALEPFTRWVIVLVKNAAIPLLFLAIFDTFIQSGFKLRDLFRLALIALFNALAAICIALLAANLIVPGKYLPLREMNTIGATDIKTLSSADAFWAFVQSPMIIAVFAAILLGSLYVFFRANYTGSIAQKNLTGISTFSSKAFAFWLKVIQLILHLIPIAVFCAVAKVVGKHGFSMFAGLSVYLVTCLAGMLIHVILVYHTWIIAYAKVSVKQFWKAAKEPVVYGFGVNSSLATLPMTLLALDKLGVSKSSARLASCVGTNFNNDGILLYQVFALVALAQAYGMDLSLTQQIMTALFAIIACAGVSGIPEAGIVALSIVLTAVNLPLEGITILLTVDWLLARCRSAINVLGDMTCAIVLDQRHSS